MKNVIFAAMAVLTLTGSTASANGWDYFWGTTVAQGLDPKLNGWDNFWNQCNGGTAGDCAAVVATGISAVVAGPIVLPVAAVVANAYK